MKFGVPQQPLHSGSQIEAAYAAVEEDFKLYHRFAARFSRHKWASGRNRLLGGEIAEGSAGGANVSR